MSRPSHYSDNERDMVREVGASKTRIKPITQRPAWAIEGNLDGRPYWAGVRNWTHDLIVPCMQGNTVALFKTRSQARAAAKKLHYGTVRKVIVVVAAFSEAKAIDRAKS